MKKSKIMILLLAMVMILAVSAVSAADIDDTSDSALGVSDEAAIDEVAAVDDAAADDAVDEVAAADESEPIVAAGEPKNFTVLQQEVDGASYGFLDLSSNYVRAENESDVVIAKDLVITGNNYTIDANNLGRIFNIASGSSVTIVGVTFINGNSDKGGAIYNDGEISVITSTFSKNNASQGGAIYNHGNAEIIGSTFSENTATLGGAIFSDNNVSVVGSTFEKNFVDDGGSAIAIDGSEGNSVYNIVGSTFNENKMDKADNPAGCGAVYAHADTVGFILSSVFTKNTASSNGLANGGAVKIEFNSVVTIQDCTFEENEATISGGAVDLQANTGANPEATIINCTFKNNKAAAGAGVAALNNVGEATLTIINSTFENNIATVAGAAVYSDRSSKTTISGAEFIANEAPLGGAIYALKDLTVNENTVFYANQAELGGAIYVAASYGDASLTVKDAVFTNNFVTDGGSAIAVKANKGKAATYDISDSKFEGNTMYDPANPAGCGAVYTVGDNGTVEGTFTNDIFTGNTATSDGLANGGAIKLEFASTATIKDCTFEDNTASVSGGAIDLQSNVNMDPEATVINCTFINNGAQAGGAIACLQNPGTGHSTLIVENSTFIENNGAYGGAIYADDFSTVTVSGSDFIGNDANEGGSIYVLKDLTVSDSTFENNTADAGAAIFVAAKYINATISINNCDFTKNRVLYAGGAILLDASYGYGIRCAITGSTFTDNNATNDAPKVCCAGGAIYMEGPVFAILTGDNFTGNKVDSPVYANGGAIKVQYDATAVIINSTFEENEAYAGAAIDLQANTGKTPRVAVINSTLRNNKAQGGAIASASNVGETTLIIIGSVFENNIATVNGGAVYGDKFANTTIVSSKFIGNKAPEGAAVYVVKNLLAFDSTFEDNTGDAGAAVFVAAKAVDAYIGILYSTFNNNSVSAAGGAILFDASYGNAINYYIAGSDFTDNKATSDADKACCAGGAIYMEGPANGTITNSTFKANKVDSPVYPNGGAIKVQFDATALIEDCIFEENEAYTGAAIDLQANTGKNPTVTVVNSTFKNNKADAGAIASASNYDETVLNIIDSTFENNIATVAGGAVYSDSFGKTSISGSKFIGNKAPKGAAVYALKDLTVDDSTFEFNNASTGAAIYIDDKYTAATLTVTNSIFDANFVDDCGAVAIYGKNGNGVKYDISGSEFTDNVAYNMDPDACCAGAAVYAEGTAAKGTIVNSTFIANIVDSPVYANGGAVKIQFGGHSKIINSTFARNEAGLTGGAIDVQSMDGVDTFVEIDGCTFNENIAGSAGGAIAVLQTTGNSYVTVTNSNFVDNEAADVGGAIYAASLDAAKLAVIDSYFASNDAPKGAAVYALDDLTVYNSEFKENTAEGGAAIYVSDKYNNPIVLVQNSTFTDNSVSEAGAGILIDSSYGNGIKFDISNSTFTGNEAVDDNETACSNGAAIFIEGSAEGTISNSIFTENYVDSPVYPNGGAIKVQHGANVVVDACTFEANEATYTGGAIDVQSNVGLDTQLTVTNSVFKNNKAIGGAAIAAASNHPVCTVSIDNCTFEGNEAQAGVVYIDSRSTATITDSKFTGNVAEAAIYDVGALALRNNTIDSVIKINSAYGGQIVTDTYIIVLNNASQDAAMGEEIELYAVIVDDNNNTILGKGNLSFTIAGEDDINATFYPGTNAYKATYVPKSAQTRVVSAVYTNMVEFADLTVKTGTLVGQKANATFTIFADNIIEGENATVYVTLFGIEDIGLNAIVTVYVNDTPSTLEIINGTGNLTVSGLAGGSYPIFAMYDGDANYNSAFASEQFFVKSISILEVAVSEAEIAYGNNQVVTFFLHDSDGDGIRYSIIYVSMNGTDFQGVTDENGMAQLILDNLDADSYTIESYFKGDEIYNATDGNKVTFEVTKAESAVAILPVTGNVTYGDDLDIIYLEINGTATIVVKDANNVTVAATVENNTISLTDLAVGTYTVTATIPETTNYKASSDEITFTVGKAYTVVIITPVSEEIVYPGEVNITYFEYNGVATIVVKDANNVTVAATVENNTIYLTGLNAGTYTVTATIPENDNYTASSDEIVFTVDKDDALVVIAAGIGQFTYPGAVNISYLEYGGIANITVVDDNGTEVPVTVANNTIYLTGLAAGYYYVYAEIPTSDNFYGDYDDYELIIEKAIPTFTSKASENNTVGGTVIISAYAPEDATGIVWLMVDGELYGTDELLAGIAVFAVDGLEAGHHSYEVTYEGDANYAGPNSDVNSFDVDKNNATDQITIDVNVPANSTDTVFTINTPKDATGYLLVDIDGNNYYAEVENGTASVVVPSLVPGNYTANVTYSGDKKYNPVSKTTNVTVPSNVPEDAITIPETSETSSPSYSIKLPSDATGLLIVDIDGTKYVAALNNGSATVTVPGLSDGKHNVTVTYTGDSKYSAVVKTTTLDVHVPVYKLSGKDVSVVYSAKGTYKVLVTKDGKAVGAGVKVTIKFNGKTKTVETDKNGYATYKFTAKLKVKKYTINVSYKDATTKNTIKVTHVIKAKNKKVKKSKKVTKVTITLKKVNKKYLKKKTLKVKFKGKTYKVKTNKKGKATWKVKKSMLKKLKVGKKYKYTVTYGKDKVTKKLTIKK